jgi:hypothetical protein
MMPQRVGRVAGGVEGRLVASAERFVPSSKDASNVATDTSEAGKPTVVSGSRWPSAVTHERQLHGSLISLLILNHCDREITLRQVPTSN